MCCFSNLLEDTNYNPKGLPENFTNALKILTKTKEVSYDDYCKSIKSVCHTNYRKCAYWVKLADMKDHLSLTNTLTDRLKEVSKWIEIFIIERCKYEIN